MGYYQIQKYGRMNLLFRRDETRKGILTRLFRKEQALKIWKNKAFVKEMERRRADFESGTDKGYTWEEVKESIRDRLAEVKIDADKFYDSQKLYFSGFKFDRNQANER